MLQYSQYIWSSYAICLLLLGWQVVGAWKEWKRCIKHLEQKVSQPGVASIAGLKVHQVL